MGISGRYRASEMDQCPGEARHAEVGNLTDGTGAKFSQQLNFPESWSI